MAHSCFQKLSGTLRLIRFPRLARSNIKNKILTLPLKNMVIWILKSGHCLLCLITQYCVCNVKSYMMLQGKTYQWKYLYVHTFYIINVHIYVIIKAPFTCSQEGREMWLKNVKQTLTMSLYINTYEILNYSFLCLFLKRKPTKVWLMAL